MTEAEWFAATDPATILRNQGHPVTDRQMRLFSCACVRRAWHFVVDDRLQECLTTIEAFADDGVKDRERGRIHALVGAICHGNTNKPQDCVASELHRASAKTVPKQTHDCGVSAAAAFGWAVHASGGFGDAKSAERLAQLPIAHDIIGNPFRPVSLDRGWLTSTVVALASRIYAERAFDLMPILADALMDAGCGNDEVLNHCRGGRGDRGEPAGGSPHQADGVHVRGCWVVDLLTGRS
jgi:hypothetical protein